MNQLSYALLCRSSDRGDLSHKCLSAERALSFLLSNNRPCPRHRSSNSSAPKHLSMHARNYLTANLGLAVCMCQQPRSTAYPCIDKVGACTHVPPITLADLVVHKHHIALLQWNRSIESIAVEIVHRIVLHHVSKVRHLPCVSWDAP